MLTWYEIHICRFGNLPWTPNGFNLDIEDNVRLEYVSKNIWEPTTRGIYAEKKNTSEEKKIKIFVIVLLLSFSFLLKEECTVPAVLIAEQQKTPLTKMKEI